MVGVEVWSGGTGVVGGIVAVECVGDLFDRADG